ncbi:MAG: N-acetyltransferase family protein [Aestuariivirga sp.]|uniref:GNAT family N-acetyltransferase n=1 Tax=Aestuariivirga sp. TaxID=2650926 RepID=UPI0038D228E8
MTGRSDQFPHGAAATVIRPMRADEVEQVAAMVRGLARDIGASTVPQLTAAGLAAAHDLIDTVVAEEHGRLTGACLGLMTYSTWRGARGLYVVDLFVMPEARGRNIGERLLRHMGRRFAARGARFIKLEVDATNAAAARFYARLGFAKKTEDRLHILEHDQFTGFISSGGET